MKQTKKTYKTLPFKTGFKFWELGKVIAAKNIKTDTNIIQLIIDGINHAYIPSADASTSSCNGFYCPRVLGYCYAYLPKQKHDTEGLRAS